LLLVVVVVVLCCLRRHTGHPEDSMVSQSVALALGPTNARTMRNLPSALRTTSPMNAPAVMEPAAMEIRDKQVPFKEIMEQISRTNAWRGSGAACDKGLSVGDGLGGSVSGCTSSSGQPARQHPAAASSTTSWARQQPGNGSDDFSATLPARSPLPPSDTPWVHSMSKDRPFTPDAQLTFLRHEVLLTNWDRDRMMAPERTWPSCGPAVLHDEKRDGLPAWKPSSWKHKGECFPHQPFRARNCTARASSARGQRRSCASASPEAKFTSMSTRRNSAGLVSAPPNSARRPNSTGGLFT